MYFKKIENNKRLDNLCLSSDDYEFNPNEPLWPSNIRALVVGPSACGKTNLVVSLLVALNGIKFTKLYLVSQTASQEKYEILKNVLQGSGAELVVLTNVDDIILQELEKHTTVIWDDLHITDYPKISQFFYRGRHSGINSLFLTQTYSVQPPAIIKQNANVLFLFKMPGHTLKLIHRDWVGCDMNLNEFMKFCNKCFSKTHDFMTIVKDFPLSEGRYRKNFDNVWVI